MSCTVSWLASTSSKSVIPAVAQEWSDWFATTKHRDQGWSISRTLCMRSCAAISSLSLAMSSPLLESSVVSHTSFDTSQRRREPMYWLHRCLLPATWLSTGPAGGLVQDADACGVAQKDVEGLLFRGSRNGYRRWSGCRTDARGEPRGDARLRSSDSRCLGE